MYGISELNNLHVWGGERGGATLSVHSRLAPDWSTAVRRGTSPRRTHRNKMLSLFLSVMVSSSQYSANAVQTSSMAAASSTGVRPCWSLRHGSTPISSSLLTTSHCSWATATFHGERPVRGCSSFMFAPASARTSIRSGLSPAAASCT